MGPNFLPSKCLFNRWIRRNNFLFHFPTKIFILHHNLRHPLRLVDEKFFKILIFYFSNFSSWSRSLCFRSGRLWFPRPLIKKFIWQFQYLWAYQSIFLCYHRKFLKILIPKLQLRESVSLFLGTKISHPRDKIYRKIPIVQIPIFKKSNIQKSRYSKKTGKKIFTRRFQAKLRIFWISVNFLESRQILDYVNFGFILI